MKKIKIILLGSAVFMSLALGLQARVSGFTKMEETAELGNVSISSNIGQNGSAKDSAVKDMSKKSILLETGIEMKYREAGNPHGRTLLMLHGYTDTSRSFENLTKEILGRNSNLRLIAPDLRGHGESSMPSPDRSDAFKMESFANDIVSFLKLKNISKVDLIGHSMGSVIAQEIALQHPDKLASLTLIGAFVDGTSNSAIQDFLFPELLDKWQELLVQRFGEDWKRKSHYMTPKDLGEEVTTFLKHNWVTETGCKPSLLESIYLETIENPLGTWFGALEALSETDNSNRMERLNTPTLIIWGTGDELILRHDQNRLLEVCSQANQRNSTPILVKSYSGDGTPNRRPGHNLHWAHAKEVALDILEFTGTENPTDQQ